jgi:hypothetical protein
VAGNDFVVIADQNRVVEAEPLDAVGDLADLLAGMGARVTAVGVRIPTKAPGYNGIMPPGIPE